MRKLLKSKKALSPVVAAIILIAVTVAVSIAVAAWMGSMTFTFMETEEIKITNVVFGTTGTITVYASNTGTTDVVISSASINDGAVTITGSPVTVEKGTPETMSLTGMTSYSAGTTYIVELLSSKGNKFSYTVTSTASYTA